MKRILILLLSLFSIQLVAQRATPDQFETTAGALSIQPIVHGTLVFTWDNKTIYVDPYGGAEKFEGIADPDIILITDIHGDHLNQNTLEALETSKATFYVPQAVMDKLSEEMKTKAITIANGQELEAGDLKIEAIPMYNLPEDETSRHPKGRGNGYILTMGGKRVYLSGDTEDITEMRSLKNIDIAFVCMNLPYTMDVNQAASAVNEFKPKVVYPYHYRGKGGLSDVQSFKDQVIAENPDIEVRLRNWYSQ